jgi:hypothetical protein
MKNPVARKLGMNPGMRALIIAPPPGYLKLLTPLPDELTVSSRADGTLPLRAGFCDAAVGHQDTQRLSKHAAPHALVWIAYPKKTSKTDSELNRDLIREAMSRFALGAQPDVNPRRKTLNSRIVGNSCMTPNLSGLSANLTLPD